MSELSKKLEMRWLHEDEDLAAGVKPSPPDRRTLEAIAMALVEAQQAADRREEDEKRRNRLTRRDPRV